MNKGDRSQALRPGASISCIEHKSSFKHSSSSALPPIRQRIPSSGLVTQTIAVHRQHSEACRCSETGCHAPKTWPCSMAANSHLATIAIYCSISLIYVAHTLLTQCYSYTSNRISTQKVLGSCI